MSLVSEDGVRFEHVGLICWDIVISENGKMGCQSKNIKGLLFLLGWGMLGRKKNVIDFKIGVNHFTKPDKHEQRSFARFVKSIY